MTLSLGVASSEDSVDPGVLIESADRALYAAKHRGRNRVVTEGMPLDPPCADATQAAIPAAWTIETSRQLGIDRIERASGLLVSESRPLVRALVGMLDLRDHEVERHSDRVMRYCLRLAREACERGIVRVSTTELSDLHLGALLHDIGKVGVPDSILHKPGALTAEEWAVVHRHPIEGAEILANFPELAGAVPVVRSHHERWDGTGYPDGLAGESIPLGARFFALADTLDAMGSDRPYRKALPFGQIRAEVRRMSGKQFDPALVEAFMAIPEEEWARLKGAEPGRLRAA